MKRMAAEWLKSASLDLENVSHIIKIENLTPVAAFHCQQCVEKCFKAVLENEEREPPKTHDVFKLYVLISDSGNFDFDQNMLFSLRDFYIDARYPGNLGLLPNGKPTLVEAREFYKFATTVYETISRKLKQLD